VSRGYIGVTLKDLDPDLERTLKLGTSRGALVQDVSADSPGERAGIRPYDVVLAVDGETVRTNDDLIRRISELPPGSVTRLELMRDGRTQTVAVRLVERPNPDDASSAGGAPSSGGASQQAPAMAPHPAGPGRALPSALLGMQVRSLDRPAMKRFEIPSGTEGVVVTTVEPMGAAEEAGIERGDVILEINRRPVRSVNEYLRAVGTVGAGDVLAVYCYVPSLGQRALRTVHVEPWQE
jgi:serine protease Do